MFCGPTLPTRLTEPADISPGVAEVGGWVAIDAPPSVEGSPIDSSRELPTSESPTGELVAFKSLMGTAAGAAAVIDANAFWIPTDGRFDCFHPASRIG